MNFLPMSSTTHLGEKRYGRLVLIGVAFLMAVFYEMFAYKHWDGIGALGFVLASSAVFLMVAKYYGMVKNKWALWFLAFPVVLGFDLFLYNNVLVRALAPVFILLFYLFFIFVLGVHQGETKTEFRFRKIPVPPLLRGIWKAVQDLTESPTQERKRTIIKVLIGIIVAVPLVLIFGSLFADADRQFADFIRDIFNFDINEQLLFRVLRLAFITIFMSAVYYALLDSRFVLKSKEDKAARKFDQTIILTVMVLLNILFLTFVFIQFKHLFFSYQNVVDSGLVFSAYARQGFFQLLWASGLALALFLVVFRSFSHHGMDVWIKSSLGLFLISTGVVAYSALHRTNLYQDAYGLTADRFYAEIIIYYIMFGLALGIAWLIMNGKFAKLFYAGLTAAAITFMIAMSINVDAVIAKKNIYLALNGNKPLDTDYLNWLSVDVTPIVVEVMKSGEVDKLSYTAKLTLTDFLVRAQNKSTNNAYLDFNLGKYLAKRSLADWKENPAAFQQLRNRLTKFKEDLNYANRLKAAGYFGALQYGKETINYQIIPKFNIKPWKENEGWTWPPHITILRADQTKPASLNYKYSNDIILYTDAEYTEMRRVHSRDNNLDGTYPYTFLLSNGRIWKMDPKNLTKEEFELRYNGSKFVLQKV